MNGQQQAKIIQACAQLHIWFVQNNNLYNFCISVLQLIVDIIFYVF